MTHVFSILIIDDESYQLNYIHQLILKAFQEPFEIFVASSGDQGIQMVQNNTIDLALVDGRMPDTNGLSVLRSIKEINPEIDVVMMTAFADIEDVISAMKLGAYDYLIKPIKPIQLQNLITRLREKRNLMRENVQLKTQIQQKFRFNAIITQSGMMEELLNLSSRVAKSNSTVLILGDSGTGKELFARAIHYASPRKDNPMVVVNIAALPDNLIESELFGHKKGAYTGADRERIGRFEQANGGSLFIDEIGDIPLSVQVKLLRMLQFKTIERLGDNQPIKVDVRIIAATHRDLPTMVKNDTFRNDLYYRLNIIALKIPPLRQRREDIPPLIDHFIKKYSYENNKTIRGITSEAKDLIIKYEFPGNVRELENIIEHAVVLSRGDIITVSDIPSHLHHFSEMPEPNDPNTGQDYPYRMKQFESMLLLDALRKTNFNQSAAARLLGISERRLRSRIQILNLKKE